MGRSRAVPLALAGLAVAIAFRVPAQAASPPAGTFVSYTPALSATSINPSQRAAVAPSLGTGGVEFGRYTRIGNLVEVYFSITFGQDADPGYGAYRVSLPVPIARAEIKHGDAIGYGHEHEVSHGYLGLGPGAYRDVVFHVNTNVDNLHAGIVIGEDPRVPPPLDDQTLNDMFGPVETDQTSNDMPWVWAQGDQITGVLTYEAA